MKHKKVGIKSKEDVSKLSFSKPGSVQPDFLQSSQVQHYRNIGNQAVQRMLESRELQAKLKIGSPNDQYEQEADRVADQVMRMEEGALAPAPASSPNPKRQEETAQTKPLAEQITPLVQKEELEEEKEEEPIQTKLMGTDQLQRQEIPEEEEKEEEGPVQAKLMGTDQLQRQEIPEEEEEEELAQAKLMGNGQLQRQEVEPEEEEEEETPVLTKAAPGSTPEVSSGIESNINTMKGGGQPLSESTRSFFEPRFGADFSQVRVHSDPHAAQTAQAINAKAFTTGKDIVFNSGQYSPRTVAGKKLLAHELTHVVQQGYTDAVLGKEYLCRERKVNVIGSKNRIERNVRYVINPLDVKKGKKIELIEKLRKEAEITSDISTLASLTGMVLSIYANIVPVVVGSVVGFLLGTTSAASGMRSGKLYNQIIDLQQVMLKSTLKALYDSNIRGREFVKTYRLYIIQRVIAWDEEVEISNPNFVDAMAHFHRGGKAGATALLERHRCHFGFEVYWKRNNAKLGHEDLGYDSKEGRIQ